MSTTRFGQELARKAAAGEAPTAQRFVCRACRLHFDDRDEMKVHFSTELHRINVGRRVEGVTAMTRAEFDEAYGSEEQFQAAQAEAAKSPSKQKAAAAAAGQAAAAAEKEGSGGEVGDEDDEGWLTDEDEDTLTLESCLFCPEVSETLQASMDHMWEAHKFQPACKDNLHDLEGLIAYLQKKITFGICLTCNEKSKRFKSIKSVQNHMISKSHCAMKWTDYEAEFEDYYNSVESTPQEILRLGDDVTTGVERNRIVLKDGRQLSANHDRPAHARGCLIPAMSKGEAFVAEKRIAAVAKSSHLSVAALMKREEERRAQKKVITHAKKLEVYHNDKKALDIGSGGNKLFLYKGRDGGDH